MAMEQKLLEALYRTLDSSAETFFPFRALLTARSLITNSFSTAGTRAAVLNALLNNPLVFPHALHLFDELISIDTSLTTQIVESIKPLLVSDNKLAANVLSVLESVPEFDSVSFLFDEGVVLSLASSCYFSVRSRVIRLIVSTNSVYRPGLVVQLLLGLSGDLLPLIRRDAVEGLVKVLKEFGDVGERSALVGCCYEQASQLLRDDDELVRAFAIRLVSKCAEVFAASEQRTNNSNIMDLIFLQLCAMARDMSVKVRLEIFVALGRARYISEDILLQSLSKKKLGVNIWEKILVDCSMENFPLPVSSASGVFVHGIEDEYYEVRIAACKSLGMLTVFSLSFADSALNLLMDMLNDDVVDVRLQALQNLFLMAKFDCLKIQEKHIHMFLGMVADISPIIRKGTRKVLQLLRLPDQKTIITSIDSLIINMQTYPEEEEDTLRTLFIMGTNHGSHAARIGRKHLQEIISYDEHLSLDSHKVRALLVLVISSPFSKEKLTSDLPPDIFSYAIPLFGKLSCSLEVFINPDDLLAYLYHYSGYPLSSASVCNENDFSAERIEDFLSKCKERSDQMCRSSWIMTEEEKGTKDNMLALHEKLHNPCNQQKVFNQWKVKYLNEELKPSIQLVLKAASETWSLMQSCCAFQVQRKLRSCMEELNLIAWSADHSVCALLAFASQYVEAMQLFSVLLSHLNRNGLPTIIMSGADIILEKLEMCMKRMKYCFPGMSLEEENHILDMSLLGYVLKLFKGESCSQLTLKQLHDLIYFSELLLGGENLSYFAKKIKILCTKKISGESQSCAFWSLLEQFQHETIQFSGNFKQIKAEIQVVGNDSENPLPFISGLPVGIQFSISIWNVSENDRVWLQMAVGETIYYTYISLHPHGVCNEVGRYSVKATIYAIPDASSFILKGSVVMDCPNLEYSDSRVPEEPSVMLYCFLRKLMFIW